MLSAKASKLHFSSLVFDTHSDSLARTVDHEEDLGTDTGRGHMDIPRMLAGNQRAQFFAAYVDPAGFGVEQSMERITDYFDAFDTLCINYPNQIEQARTADDVRKITESGKIAGILCVEGGHAMTDDLDILRLFQKRGVRYMTLTHNMSNNWADGIQDESGSEAPTDWSILKEQFLNQGWIKTTKRHNGLTDFGREVVQEMNSLGIIVDISHVARKTFWDVMETTSKPVMASHSSSWSICQNPRNIDDDQLKAVSQNNGVACVNFEVTFISQKCNQETREVDRWRDSEISKLNASEPENSSALELIKKEHAKRSAPLLRKPVYTEIVDHIDHMVRVAGIDHVGIGSDFDGSRTPTGMEDCTRVPFLTEEMINRGYSDTDIQKILGLNVLRVMEQVVDNTLVT